jgi:hypothetical protein
MITNITDIFKIFDDTSSINEKKYTNDKESFLDYENSLDDRVISFLNMYQKDNLEAYELITDLCSIYNFSPIENVYQLVEKLLLLNNLELNIRFPLLSTVYYKEKEIEHINMENKKFGNKGIVMKNEIHFSDSFTLFIKVLESCFENNSIFNSTIYLDILRFILDNENKNKKDLNNNIYNILEFLILNKSYIINIKKDDTVNTDEQIKIKEMEYFDHIYKYFNTLTKNDKYNNSFIMTSLFILYKNCYDKLKIIIITLFLTNTNNFIKEYNFYIKHIDNLIELKNICEYKDMFINDLCFIFNNNSDYNTRADAADLLLKFNTEKTKELGRNYLDQLTSEKGKKLFYENEQNVHKFEVNDNVQEFIRYISSCNDLTFNSNKEEDYFKMCEEELFKELSKTNESSKDIKINEKNIQKSLNRIYMDTFKYEGYTIANIFIKIWFIIRKHNNRTELTKRLFEELEDMHDTCSSGHILRLINVFSGFGFNLKIEVEIEIKNKLYHMIGKMIEKHDDEDLINEMTNKEEFNKFSLYFMKHMDSIYKELWLEYKEILNEDDFKEIFRTQTMTL